MKKLMIISFVLALLMSAVAVAQYGGQQPDNSKSGMSMKAVSITGTISDDGKMFVNDKDGKSWAISNPDAVKGHEGHHVILQVSGCRQERGSCRVLKMAKDSMASGYPPPLSPGQRSCWPFLFARRFKGS